MVALSEMRTYRGHFSITMPAIPPERLQLIMQEGIQRLVAYFPGGATATVSTLVADPVPLTADEMRALPIGAAVSVGTDERSLTLPGIVVSRPSEMGHPILNMGRRGMWSGLDLPAGTHVYPERSGG